MINRERVEGVAKESGFRKDSVEKVMRLCRILRRLLSLDETRQSPLLKGTARRARREAEGYDDVTTFGVLAAEGFLPGYGLDVGTVLSSAEIPFWRTGAMDFSLPRATSVALREYVPGNLIYANGHRFVARRFHRDVDEDRVEMPVFEVSTERQAVKPTNVAADTSGLGAINLRTIAVCDVDLMHQSHISDEEELRFQMGVAVYGLERDQHAGGTAWRWGGRALHLRKGVNLRLVNVGSSSAIERFARFGYPICTVCGQSVSPLSSDKQREHFAKSHAERCGRAIEPTGFYADVVADALSLPACENHSTAYSVLEAVRMAATRILDMHLDDLQILVIGHTDREEVDGILWDPMPGGSGLLDRICERFEEVVAVAREIVEKCPSACERSCIDCMQTFRNAFYHKYLARHLALERLDAWGPRLARGHDIPPKQPAQEPEGGSFPVNEAERRLRHLLRAAAGNFGEEQMVEPEGWVEPDTRRKLDSGMFVAQVVGKSMEPRIPDGSYCLFRRPVAGTRQNKTVLVKLRDSLDPESGERFTVKRYFSEKIETEESWHHRRIELRPENPEYEVIVLDAEQSEQLQVLAELLEVLSDGESSTNNGMQTDGAARRR